MEEVDTVKVRRDEDDGRESMDGLATSGVIGRKARCAGASPN